jgi:hypothetical protein
MAKRHDWSRGNGWMVCVDCGCRYRTGNFTKEYEQPDGRRTTSAEECKPRKPFPDVSEAGTFTKEAWDSLKPSVVETSSPKTWDELVARNKAATLDDGFGNMWLKCDRGDCGLHIVRPGKVQCEHEQCPTSHKSE